MQTKIEGMDRRRMRSLGAYLISFAPSVPMFLALFFLRESGLSRGPIGTALKIGLGASLLAQIAFIIKQVLLAAEINRDPKLKEAFDSELHRLLEARAWKAAFIGTAATALLFAIASSFYPVCDALTIALTSMIIGVAAQRATFYFKYRAL